MKTIRVLVADDHTILREGVVALLNGSGDLYPNILCAE